MALRCRVGDLRVPLSLVEAGGESFAVIHQVAHRSRVYDTAAFRARLDAFHEEIYDGDLKSWKIDPCSTAYEFCELLPDSVTSTDHAAIEPWLSSPQSKVLSGLLPFPTTWGAREALLLIAKGAPGSGKTLVAAELADVAASLCGYDVLLLVPTLKLKEHYKQWIDTSPGAEQVSIELVQDFFQDCAGNQPGEVARLSRLRSWWEEALAQPAFNAWASQYPIVRSARFLALVDSTLSSDVDAVLSAKDALDTADAGLYDRCRDLQGKESWLRTLERLQATHELTLRCQAAQSLRPSYSAYEDNPLLVVVDECQDLAPAEWQALLRLVDARQRADRGTRIALLGDEAQRISPTSFAWAEVAQHAVTNLGWSANAVQEVVLPGSYRVPREIGASSVRVFRPPLADLGKSRHVNLLDPNDLPEGGELTILTHDDLGAELQDLDQALRALASSESMPVVMVDAESLMVPRGLSTSVERLPIELAKGLEFGAIIVNSPLTRPLPLSFDRAAAFYTALTRTTRRAICLVPRGRWETLKAGGFAEGCAGLDLSEPLARQRAISLMLQFAEATTTTELAEVLKARVRGTFDEYRLSTDGKARANMLRDVVQDFGRLVHLEAVEFLGVEIAESCADLAELPGVFTELGELPDEQQAGIDLVLGRFGAVVALSEQEGTPHRVWAREVAKLAEREMGALDRRIRASTSAGASVRQALGTALAAELLEDREVDTTSPASAFPSRTIHESSLAMQLDEVLLDLMRQLESFEGLGPGTVLDPRLEALGKCLTDLEGRVRRLAIATRVTV